MENALKDIDAISGVTGCFVCTGKGEVLVSTLPDVFDQSILSSVGQTINRTMAGLTMARRKKAQGVDLVYSQNRLIAKTLGDGCLCILCVRNINMPLLNLAASAAERKLAAGVRGEARERPSPRRPVAQPPGGEVVDAAFLGRLQQELARAIGPIAPVVIDEGIEALGVSRESLSRDKASQLVEKVSAEIAEEGKRLRFVEACLRALGEQ